MKLGQMGFAKNVDYPSGWKISKGLTLRAFFLKIHIEGIKCHTYRK